MRAIDLVGQKFGRLTVVDYSTVGPNYKLKCTCDCGKTVHVFRTNLVSGRTKSCGCLTNVGLSRKLYREAWHTVKDFVKTKPTIEQVATLIDDIDPDKIIRTNNTEN